MQLTGEIIRQKRRFEMFDKSTKKTVLEVNSFFGKYNMHFDDKIKKKFTYYDTPNNDLQKSRIALFKTQIGNFTELNMATEKISATHRYTTRDIYKHVKKIIKPHDSIFKHKDFLINSFQDMFMSSLNFDPEFLLRKLQEVIVIETVSEEYRSVNPMGLKITYSFDADTYTNFLTNKKASANILTIYEHSPKHTDADFEDLYGKLIRYCKELTPTNENKITIARRMTAISASDYLDNKNKKKKKSK